MDNRYIHPWSTGEYKNSVSEREKILLNKARLASSAKMINRVSKTFDIHHLNPFEPQLLSIGPYHYRRCPAMDEHKYTKAMRIKEGTSGYVKMICSASEMVEAGIKFKRRDANNLFDIKFENGKIEMPFLPIDSLAYTTLVNVMAFEQCSPESQAYFTSYAYLMDCLVNTQKDVEILSENGIIDHWLGSNEAAAGLFNNIGLKTALDAENFYYCDLFNQINQYCERAWPKFMVSLRRDYFSNPWTIISTIAAVILLILTFAQTFYAAFPNFTRHP